MCKVKYDKSAVIFTCLHPNMYGMLNNPTVLKSRPATWPVVLYSEQCAWRSQLNKPAACLSRSTEDG